MSLARLTIEESDLLDTVIQPSYLVRAVQADADETSQFSDAKEIAIDKLLRLSRAQVLMRLSDQMALFLDDPTYSGTTDLIAKLDAMIADLIE